MSSKRTVVLLTLAAGLALLVASFRPWVTGSSSDPVLAGTPLTALGSDAAPGLLSLATAVLAAGVAAVTTGPLARRIALVGYAAVLALVGGLALRALASPAGVLGPLAAAEAGRTGTLTVTAQATVWVGVALLGVLLGVGALAGAVRGQRSWGGLGARYESDSDVPGDRGERVSSAWDELSAGRDPTDEAGDPPSAQQT